MCVGAALLAFLGFWSLSHDCHVRISIRSASIVWDCELHVTTLFISAHQ